MPHLPFPPKLPLKLGYVFSGNLIFFFSGLEQKHADTGGGLLLLLLFFAPPLYAAAGAESNRCRSMAGVYSGAVAHSFDCWSTQSLKSAAAVAFLVRQC